MSDSKAKGAIVGFLMVIAAIGVVIFVHGLNLGGTANQSEVYFGIVLWCIGLFGALLVLAILG